VQGIDLRQSLFMIGLEGQAEEVVATVVNKQAVPEHVATD
jgi:hypothetical protein